MEEVGEREATQEESVEPSDQSTSQELDSYTDEDVSDVIVRLEKTQRWLKARESQIKSGLVAAHDTRALPDDEIKCTEEIHELSTQLLKCSSDNSVKELMLRRILLGVELEKNLFGGHGPTAGGDAPHESLVEYTKKQASLVSEVLDEDQEIQQLQNELTDLQKQNRDIKITNRQLMSELQRIKTDKEEEQLITDDATIRRSKQNLKETSDKMELLRHTLQALIVGSGVNWAQDSELKEMVINLGTPFKSKPRTVDEA